MTTMSEADAAYKADYEEMILNTVLEVTKRQDLRSVNARSISGRLQCSHGLFLHVMTNTGGN